MRIMLYAVGGGWLPSGSSGDTFVGCAHDADTGIALLDAIEHRGGYAVSLHGEGLESWATSTVCSVRTARILFNDARRRESQPAGA